MPNESNYVVTENNTEENKKLEEVKTKTKADNKDVVSETKKKEKQDRDKTKTEENGVITKTKEKENKTKETLPVVETKPDVKKENNSDKVKTKPVVEKTNVPVALPYNERKEHLQQTVTIASDSLLLSFYDNGVVDGDSISVYLNDKPVITTRLTSIATKKSIYIGGMEEVKLLLVAENLGSIPPNTGLLIIREGDKTYQVNFTADMQTNASIILRRKRNQ